MKMKKKIILVLALVFLLSLTACKSSDDKPFDYNESTLAYMTIDIINTYKDVDGDAVEYYLNEGTELESSAVKGFQQIQTTDNVGKFISVDEDLDDAKFEVGSNDDILCTVRCKYEDRDVDVRVSYVKNLEYYKQREELIDYYEKALQSQYGMTLEDAVKEDGMYASVDEFIDSLMLQQGVYPYKAVQAEVSAVYSKSELLSKAGQNTAIGMVTVFCVLIFISFIISLLKFVPMIFDPSKKDKKAAAEALKEAKPEVKKEEVKASPAPAASESEDLVNDEELVAVITAALYAAFEDTKIPNAVSKDTLIVRSIRKVR